MRRVRKKDVFIVHSKASVPEAGLFESVAPFFSKLGYTVWGYNDWNWEHEVQQAVNASSGTHLNVLRSAIGHPEPFDEIEIYEEIDRGRLKGILSSSRAIILVDPASNRFSKGVRFELGLLIPFAQRDLRYLRCTWKEEHRHRYLERFKTFGALKFSSEAVSENRLLELTLLLARLVLLQSVTDAREYQDTAEAEEEGLFDFPKYDLKKDLLRARSVLSMAREKGDRRVTQEREVLGGLIEEADVLLEATLRRYGDF